MKELVYMYRNGDTQLVSHHQFTEDIIRSAYGPEHWNERENAYIFTKEKFNEEVLHCKTKLF